MTEDEVWVSDPRAPSFPEEARRQAALLRDAPGEAEVLDFIEAAAADLIEMAWPSPEL